MSALKNSAQLRQTIEDTLSARIPSALSPRGRVELERTASGVTALDKLLRGGLPVGVVSELVGPESSGRTTAALSFVAGITRSDRVAAWIDVSDTLDPESAAANGVDLARLLWVRCGGKDCAAAGLEACTQGMMLPVSSSVQAIAVRGGGSPHPRSEGLGMSQAISAMLQHGGMYDKQMRREKKMLGTPGAPNRPLNFRSVDREEQVASDRVPSHRAEQATARRVELMLPTQELRKLGARAGKRPWDALDQALKSVDLLLQGGGFSVVVLDLGSVPPEMAWRIPLATWFRFRAACERTQMSLLALTQHPCTRSSAELVVRMTAGDMLAQSKVMTGIAYTAEVERQRRPGNQNVLPIRKQPQPERGARWNGNAAWASGR